MTDRSYACLASGLADAIAQNWRQYQAESSPAARLATVLGIVDSGPGEGP